jgi:hypothetical protein
MYATIEADIENGVIKGCDTSRLPSHAHVLITLLRGAPSKRPAFGTKTSKKIIAAPDAFLPLTDSELAEWGL